MADDKKVLYVSYEMFGAKGDGVTDDTDAIRAAHVYANENKIDVKTDPFATYYIGENRPSIPVCTNCDFSTTRFIIDDTKVTVDERGASLFIVESTKSPIQIELNKLKKNQMRIDQKLPCNCYVKVDNANKKQFIRLGLNQNKGSNQTDSFVCDSTGYILNKVIWDFDEVTSAVAYPIDETVLTIQGGIFTSIANQAESKYTYYSRNIVIKRSNTVIKNITHLVEGELDHGAPYTGFITVSSCAFVTVENCHLSPRMIYSTIGAAGKPVSMGSYAFSASHAVNLRILNLKQNGIMDNTHWGLMATNHCKDLYFDNCVISRYDAHENVANLTLKNCVLGHQCFNAIGHGLMTVENVTAYGGVFMNLRGDYGSTWDGDVSFRNCTWYPRSDAKTPSVIGGNNAGGHYFGFPCYLPHKISIDGLLICDGQRGDNYVGVSVFNANSMNASSEIDFYDKDTAYPYIFSEKLTLKNIRTESGKGIRLFHGDSKQCFSAEKVVSDENGVYPNFRAYIEDVELSDSPIVDQSALDTKDYENSYHVVPRIEIKNCRNVVLKGSSTPATVVLEDCTLKENDPSECMTVIRK